MPLLLLLATHSTAKAAERDPLQRNPDLELAVVNHLLDHGFGGTNRILMMPGLQSPPGETPDDYEHRWAQSAKDRRLQREVAKRLQEAIPGGRDLYVLVQNEQAFLFGRVRTQQQRQQAQDSAQDVKGIERVENRTIVAEQGWAAQDDATIEEAIREGLSRSPFVDSEPIEVDVDDGRAVLNGVVDGFSELVVAVERAFRGGARSVHIQLRIIPQNPRTSGSPAIDSSGLP